MRLITNRFMSFPPIAVLLVVVMTTSAFGEIATQSTAEPVQVAKQFGDFKRTAFELRREASTLKSFVPGMGLHYETHAQSLNTLRDRVNSLGKTLAKIEALKPLASQNHGLAIEHARPHLVSVAQNLTQAIKLVSEDSRSIRWGEYRDTVNDIHTHADALYTKLDTILDFEKARTRLDNLGLQSASNQGT